MTEHSPEPWEVSVYLSIVDADDNPIFLECSNLRNAQRVVACVNACKHLPTNYLEWLAENERFLVGTSVKSIAAAIAEYERITSGNPQMGSLINRMIETLKSEETPAKTPL
jgi:hypothetical protein